MKHLAALLLGVSFSVLAETITLETDIVLSPPPQTMITEEYSPAGFVERVKITPTWGASYYLVPIRGGDRFDAIEPTVYMAQWSIFKW